MILVADGSNFSSWSEFGLMVDQIKRRENIPFHFDFFLLREPSGLEITGEKGD